MAGELHRTRAAVACPRHCESVKLRGNSTGRVPWRSESDKAACPRRQAKGELHRTCAVVACPRRSESVKLRGNACRGGVPAAFRIRQAKGELHRTRAAVAFRNGGGLQPDAGLTF